MYVKRPEELTYSPYLECNVCNLKMWGSSKEELIESWNSGWEDIRKK